jgi:hypothetical protein
MMSIYDLTLDKKFFADTLEENLNILLNRKNMKNAKE